MAVILSARADVRRTLIDVDKLQRLQVGPLPLPLPQPLPACCPLPWTPHLTFTWKLMAQWGRALADTGPAPRGIFNCRPDGHSVAAPLICVRHKQQVQLLRLTFPSTTIPIILLESLLPFDPLTLRLAFQLCYSRLAAYRHAALSPQLSRPRHSFPMHAKCARGAV